MKSRKDFMTADQRAQLGVGARRFHHVCRKITGVNRPGKTAQDRAKRGGEV